MITQSEIDELVLGYLYQKTDEGRHLTPEDEIVAWFEGKKIKSIRVRHALDSLVGEGFIEERLKTNVINVIVSDYGNEVRAECAYKISLTGLTEFERQRDEKAERRKADLADRRTSVLSPSADNGRAIVGSINWTKSGAFAGWLAILLTIVGIFVALWIAGKI